MSNKYTLLGLSPSEDRKVRLVGIINNKECEAIINDKNAARKISTSESIKFDDFKPYTNNDKRFVIVSLYNIPKFNNTSPIVFISPIIDNAYYTNYGWTVVCKSNKPNGGYDIFRFRNNYV